MGMACACEGSRQRSLAVRAGGGVDVRNAGGGREEEEGEAALSRDSITRDSREAWSGPEDEHKQRARVGRRSCKNRKDNLLQLLG